MKYARGDARNNPHWNDKPFSRVCPRWLVINRPGENRAERRKQERAAARKSR